MSQFPHLQSEIVTRLSQVIGRFRIDSNELSAEKVGNSVSYLWLQQYPIL